MCHNFNFDTFIGTNIQILVNIFWIIDDQSSKNLEIAGNTSLLIATNVAPNLSFNFSDMS